MEPDNIMVRVLKYDGTEYRHWNATLARREGSLVVLDAEFETDVSHHLLGEIKRGTRTVEYYWLDRWYNVFRFLSEDGETRLYYCNINTLPSLEDGVLTYIDLDIDLLVQPDSSYRVLDLEEFDDNAIHYGYSDQVKAEAHGAVIELISLIESHEFPFLFDYLSAPSGV
jgi:protein associated with RNAse G/E